MMDLNEAIAALAAPKMLQLQSIEVEWEVLEQQDGTGTVSHRHREALGMVLRFDLVEAPTAPSAPF